MCVCACVFRREHFFCPSDHSASCFSGFVLFTCLLVFCLFWLLLCSHCAVHLSAFNCQECCLAAFSPVIDSFGFYSLLGGAVCRSHVDKRGLQISGPPKPTRFLTQIKTSTLGIRFTSFLALSDPQFLTHQTVVNTLHWVQRRTK